MPARSLQPDGRGEMLLDVVLGNPAGSFAHGARPPRVAMPTAATGRVCAWCGVCYWHGGEHVRHRLIPCPIRLGCTIPTSSGCAARYPLFGQASCGTTAVSRRTTSRAGLMTSCSGFGSVSFAGGGCMGRAAERAECARDRRGSRTTSLAWRPPEWQPPQARNLLVRWRCSPSTSPSSRAWPHRAACPGPPSGCLRDG